MTFLSSFTTETQKNLCITIVKVCFLVKCFLCALDDPSVALKSYGYVAKGCLA